MGVRREYAMTVSEPAPGRLLIEEDDKTGVTTSFTLEELPAGQGTQVTISTEMLVSPGLQGVIEKWLDPGVLRKIYREQLRNLEDYVRDL
jgi:hypothetical protein